MTALLNKQKALKVMVFLLFIFCFFNFAYAVDQNACNISCKEIGGIGGFNLGPPSDNCPLTYYPYWGPSPYYGGREFWYQCGIFIDDYGQYQDKACGVILPGDPSQQYVYVFAYLWTRTCNYPEYNYIYSTLAPSSCVLQAFSGGVLNLTFYPFWGTSASWSYDTAESRYGLYCTYSNTTDHIFYRTELCPRLNVPLIKQCDSRWRADAYDHKTKTTLSNGRCTGCICSDGCALTSAVMVLRYYGITTGIDGNEVNPGNLNEWLKGHNGYTRRGGVKWSQITDYSGNRVSFIRTDGRNDAALNNDLCCKARPVILNVPTRRGHFVVATGYQCSDTAMTWTINDPGYNRITLQDYGNTYLGMRRTQFR